MGIILSQVFDQRLQFFQPEFVDFNIKQNGILNIGVGQNNFIENCAAEICLHKLRSGQDSAGQISALQIGSGQVCA